MGFLCLKRFFVFLCSVTWLISIFLFISIPICLAALLLSFPNVTVNQIVFHFLYLSLEDVYPYARLLVGVLLLLTFLTYCTYKWPFLFIVWITFYFYIFFCDINFQNIKVSDIAVDEQVSIAKQIRLSLQWSNIYETYYREPQFHEPKNKKNIILIFAESLEDNFSDAKYWGENLIPNLSELKKEGLNFKGYEQINGTNWTLASNVSTFCGVPLRMHFRDRLGVQTNQFMPHIKCLPDILKEEGYYNVFVKGADITFVGTNKFISEHSFDEVYGRDEMMVENYATVEDIGIKRYGINDQKMFEFARLKIRNIAQKKQPFFISLQTLDNHFPNGFVSPSCEIKYSDSRDAIKCSEKAIYDFVRWIQQQDFYDNSIIVIVGDHLMMSASDIADMSEVYPKRQIYNVILEKKSLPKIIEKPYSMMDWSATIADKAGIVSDKRFGLGVSLLSGDKTLTEKLGAQKFEDELLKNSAMYNDFLGLHDEKSDIVYATDTFNLPRNKMIAHLGDIEKYTSNDLQKILDLSVQRGYKYIEIDMPSLNYETILEFFEKHIDMWLIIGKVSNFALINEKLGKIKERIISEIGFENQIEQANKYGFKHLVYFLSSSINTPLVLTNNIEFVNVSMEFLQIHKYTLQNLRRMRGIKIMVYGINNKNDVQKFDDLADMIYYDEEDNLSN
ncbi:MAG: sulfatase-like hydrolase/transferase [Alphaproteobacteria bacterium]|nr:sulfatase-like hydrolase/transferase [Alphaproteobacteria bacterium]